MTMTMTEDTGGTSLQKGLSEWWSEETEYVFQRIERWAAFARGYNRLRSQRFSRGRMTFQTGGQEPSWSVSSNKLTIDDGTSWSPRFHALKKSRRRSRTEETRNINCCGTFNYQSNSNLDSNCLETYRYDHSIYFKTIGDIRNSKRDIAEKNVEQNEERISISSEELVEWDVESVSDFITNEFLFKYEIEVGNDVASDKSEDPKLYADRINSSAWPIVDLAKLDINMAGFVEGTTDEQNNETNLTEELAVNEEESNNNCTESTGFMEDVNLNNDAQENHCDYKDSNDKEEQNNGTKRFLSFSRTRRLSRTVKDDNVIWPNALLNYTRNIEPNNSAHRHRVLQK